MLIKCYTAKIWLCKERFTFKSGILNGREEERVRKGDDHCIEKVWRMNK